MFESRVEGGGRYQRLQKQRRDDLSVNKKPEEGGVRGAMYTCRAGDLERRSQGEKLQ